MTHSPGIAANVLRQMATVLPPGETVDRLVLYFAETFPGSPHYGLPLPTSISAEAVRSLQWELRSFPGWMPELIIGLRDLEALREVLDSWPQRWVPWAVALNPLSVELRDDVMLGDLPSDLILHQLVPALLLNHQEAIERFPDLELLLLADDPAAGTRLSQLWPWGRAPFDPDILPAEVTRRWEEQSRPVYKNEENRQRVIAIYMGLGGGTPGQSNYLSALFADPTLDHAGVITKILADLPVGPGATQRLGGYGYMNPWLEEVVLANCLAWQHVLGPQANLPGVAVKPLAGESLGRELYRRVGDSSGAWLLAVETGLTWDGSIPEWLTLQEVANGRGVLDSLTHPNAQTGLSRNRVYPNLP